MNDAQVYLDHVTSNHQARPKYMEWLNVLVQMWVDYAACAEQIKQVFNLNSATGKQLDMLGALCGVSRMLPFMPNKGSRVLDDKNYRRLIYARIAQDLWDGTNETLPAILNAAFPEMGIVIRDNGDMTVSAVVRGTFTDLQLEMLNFDMLIPRPAGVHMTYEVPTAITEGNLYLAGGMALSQIDLEG